MYTVKEEYARPEYFSKEIAADSRRKEFNIKNHCLLRQKLHPDFLFIGDSITHFWELHAYFRLPGQLIVNRGIGGDTTAYLEKRFYADALQLNPEHCVLGIGINDSIELDGDYWKLIPPTPYDEVLSRAKENISSIIRQARDAGTDLILTSLLPIDMPISLHEAERKQYILDLNLWLKDTARENGLIFADYFSAMAIPGTDALKDGTTYDGLHPNAYGYEIMADTLRSALSVRNIAI